ncbi:MAG: proline--tRNA ligase [Gammaproteobacteria bacterium TMED1]|nr:MAG: proline--tRNA ligase [Gammaproteobacteria bacterium TMED1]|tara:strand:+ start:2162 stop:3886 length:1725 start_codon:yes stop_codon:yes gene_type:complete
MKASKYNINTLKEVPADADIISHQLMIRAGFIRKVASGIYNWLPIGLRVLHKVENIIRQEMNAAGALEVTMPVVQPAELWQESGRWSQYDEGMLLKFKDRHQRDFCLGPTHEEIITDVAKTELRSHKQLPVNFYQIQTKFRDETRPRFGVLRAREFIMKDAYSFHLDQESLEGTYQLMHDTYAKILNKMRLKFRAVDADSGSIGGNASMEFHVLADSGEDKIAFSTESSYAANIEMAEAKAPANEKTVMQSLQKIATPNAKTIEEVSKYLNIPMSRLIKTLVVKGKNVPFVALALRGDHQLNTLKAEKISEISKPLTMATEKEVFSVCGASIGSIGIVRLDLPIIADRSAAAVRNFVCGANENDFHLANANWERDTKYNAVYDLRNIEEGDPSPDGVGQIKFKRGIEVGHIFQLGKKYSEKMNAKVLDEKGASRVMTMGCYGMGVSRLVGAIIEQHHDENGIVWPTIIAPFHIVIIPINSHKSDQVTQVTQDIYTQLIANDIEVLLDDREGYRPGVKFMDSELLGIPFRLVIGERGLTENIVELTSRRSGEIQKLPLKSATQKIMEFLKVSLGS